MYAVIKTGGKQYRVAKNDVIKIERLAGEVGAEITFPEVLMIGGDNPVMGSPTVAGARVTGSVLDQIKADKVIIFKKRRRKNFRRRNGHRQLLTVVRIADIVTAESGRAESDRAESDRAESGSAPAEGGEASL